MQDNPVCTSIDVAESLPEPGWIMNCADDTTDPTVRFERKYPLANVHTKNSPLVEYEMKGYGGRTVDKGGTVFPGYRTSTPRLAGVVFAMMLCAVLLGVASSPRVPASDARGVVVDNAGSVAPAVSAAYCRNNALAALCDTDADSCPACVFDRYRDVLAACPRLPDGEPPVETIATLFCRAGGE